MAQSDGDDTFAAYELARRARLHEIARDCTRLQEIAGDCRMHDPTSAS